MNQIGQIQKPAAGDYMQGRKAYMVRLVQNIPGAPDEYRKLCNAYWDATETHLATIEAKTGVVKHIFCEGVPGKGEDAKVTLETANPGAAKMLLGYFNNGLKIDRFEDDDLLFEVLDWLNCFNVGFISQKVAAEVQANYQKAALKRRDLQQKLVGDAVQADEAALILCGAPSELGLPDDMQRFMVSPPELDKLERWLRDMAQQISQRHRQAAERAAQEPPPPSAQGGDGGAVSDSGLWTPD